MNFYEFLQQIQEARFQPIESSAIQRIEGAALENLLVSLGKKAFDPNQIRTGYGNMNIDVGERHFSMSIQGTCRLAALRDMQLPQIYISFDWNDRNKERLGGKEQLSDKEQSGYYVRQQVKKDTIDSLHRIRDIILRELSKYAVVITYIAIGERRASLYESVLAGSGFKKMPSDYDAFWIPTNLQISPPA